MSQPVQQDAESFLMGGAGAKSLFNRNDGVGTVREITIESWEMQQQRDDDNKPLIWDDGNPRMQLVVTGATSLRDPSIEGDDGERRLFLKGDIQKVVAKAVRDAGEKFIARGGVIKVARASQDEPKGMKSGAWRHQALYTPPAAGFLMGDEAATSAAAPVDLMATPATTAAAPVATAAPAAAPVDLMATPAAATAPAATQAAPAATQAPASIGAVMPDGVNPVLWSTLGPEQQASIAALDRAQLVAMGLATA